MTVLDKQILVQFKQRYTDVTDWVDNCVVDVEGSIWRTPQDIKMKYRSASFLHKNTVIFNVKGNHYRLETKVAYQTAVVKVIWAGTHQDYDKRTKALRGTK